ncbi:MAG: glycoside hydrolase, partial [Bacteroidales bacterium]|nr:glycoside hydrolase [Bacteroidales bacterium]
VDTPDGSEHWFLHFQDLDAYGRVVLLQPVKWVDGWPVMGIDADGDLCGDPVVKHKKPSLAKQPMQTPVESDTFSNNKLGLQWQWHSNANALWHFADARQGVLRLFSWPWPVDGKPAESLWNVGNLLLQKFPAPNFKATAKVRFHPSDKHLGERCGLVVMGLDYAALALENTESGIKMTQVQNVGASKGKKEVTKSDAVTVAADQWIWLRTTVKNEGDKAICTFFYSTDGKKFKQLGETFTAAPGKWIGAKVGMFCTRAKLVTNDGGWMDADDFIIDKL